MTGDTGAHGIDPGAEELAFRLQRAFDVAHRYLAHRDRTEAEVRARLAQAEVDPAHAEHVVETLLDQRYLDDRRFAARFAEDRRNLDGWGSERIEQRLRELGVDPQLAADAAAHGAEEELQAALDVLEQRFPDPPRDQRDLNRALGLLVRRGYELELAHDALREHSRRAA